MSPSSVVDVPLTLPDIYKRDSDVYDQAARSIAANFNAVYQIGGEQVLSAMG